MRALAVRREHRVDRRARRRRASRANSRLRDQPSGAWGSGVSVLRCTGRPDAARHGADQRAVVVVVAGEERAGDELDRAAAELGEHAGERDQLVGRGVVRRHAAPVVRDVQLELRRREADRALAQRGADELLHRRDLVGGRGALRRVVAHHVAAHRAVPDVRADVHAERGRRARRGSRRSVPPAKSTPAASASADMPSTRLSISSSHATSSGSARREREAAVAGEQRGDAVPRRGRRGRVPVQLRVVVRVDVDEAGRDEQAVGVDDLARRVVVERDRSRRSRPSRTATSAVRAGAPVPSTTVPPRMRRSSVSHVGGVMPYRSSALRPNSPARASGSMSSVCSRSSSTTPGYFASLCGKSRRPDEAVGADERRRAPAPCARPGSKLIQHCRWKYSLGVERQRAASPSRSSRGTRRAGPSSARSSRRRTRAPRPSAPGCRSSTPPYTRFDSVICWSNSRMSAWCVPGAIRCPSARDAPGMSARPAGWNPSGRPVSSSASHTGVYARWWNGRSLYAFGRANPADEPEVRDAVRLVGRARRVLQRQRADADEPVGRAARTTRRSSRCRPRHDATASSRILDAAELQAEARVHHRRCRCPRRRAPSRARAASKPAGFRSS